MMPATPPPAALSPRRRLVPALLVGCLAACALGLSAPSASAGVSGGNCSSKNDVTFPVRTFHIEWKWDKKSYKVGQTAKLAMTVTRPSHEDPASDEGEPLPMDPPASAPAEDVTVGVGLYVNDVFLSGGGITDADGKLTAPIKIQSYTKPGAADMTIYAFKRYLTETRCVYVQEFSYVKADGVFKVTR